MKIEETILLEENELKPNRYAASAMLYAMIGFAFSALLNELGIFHVSAGKMRSCLMLTVLCSALVQFVARNPRTSCRPETKYWVLALVLAEILAFSVVISQWSELLLAFPILLAVQYHNRRMTILSILGAFLLALVCGPLSVLLALPDPEFYQYQLTMLGYQVQDMTKDIQYCAWDYLPGILLWISVPRCLAVVALGPVAVYITEMAAGNVQSRADATYYSAVDMMTGLYNRFSFEERVNQYRLNRPQKLTCIYADADGLHEINNQQGHAAGDALLKACAGGMAKAFGEWTYRIGGDEFAAFVETECTQEIQDKVNQICASLGEQGYHLSIGVGFLEPGKTVDTLIKDAENQMYAAKRAYYTETGKDRRKNRGA